MSIFKEDNASTMMKLVLGWGIMDEERLKMNPNYDTMLKSNRNSIYNIKERSGRKRENI